MKKPILIILIILIVIGGIIFVLSCQVDHQTNINQPNQTNEENQSVDQQDNLITDDTKQVDDQKDAETDIIPKPVDEKQILKQRARVFAQRYGTFSSDGQFRNLYELRSLMIPSFWHVKEAYIQSFNSDLDDTDEFYSLRTTALSVELINFTDQQAQYLVNCQQQEIKEDQQQILYRTLQIIFVKQADQWLVNQAQYYNNL